MPGDAAPIPTDIQAIRAALRHLKEEVLFAFGAEGDECIQRLVAVEASLPGGQAAVFAAFHQGMTAQERADTASGLPNWPGMATLRLAYEMGGRTVALNAERRRDSRMNVGPLDTPRTQLLLARAVDALHPQD